MPLNFVPRVSGRRKAGVQTTHFIGSAELASMLARFSSSGYSYSVGDNLTRHQLSRLVREIVKEHGQSAYLAEGDWAEDFAADVVPEMAEWAAVQVRILHPELNDQALAEWRAQYPEVD